MRLPFHTFRHRREMTELHKRHNEEFVKLMVRMNSFQDGTTSITATTTSTVTTAPPGTSSTTTIAEPSSRNVGDDRNAVLHHKRREDQSAPSSSASLSSITSESERRSLSRHGSQELLDYQQSTTSNQVQTTEHPRKKHDTASGGGKKDADLSKKIDLEEMYKKQLDLMGVKPDLTVKTETKVVKLSLNELKMQKQVKQMNNTNSSSNNNNNNNNNSNNNNSNNNNNKIVTTSSITLPATSNPVATTISGSRTPTMQRKSSVPAMPSHEQSHDHSAMFYNSLSSMNLSQLLHNFEVRERRNKSRTAPVQMTTLMAALDGIEATKQESMTTAATQLSQSVPFNTTHYHTIGAGDPHLIWTHNAGQMSSISHTTNNSNNSNNSAVQCDANITQPLQFYRELFQSHPSYASAAAAATSTEIPLPTNNHHHHQYQPQQQQQQQNAPGCMMSSSWSASHGPPIIESRSNSMGNLDSIPVLAPPGSASSSSSSSSSTVPNNPSNQGPETCS